MTKSTPLTALVEITTELVARNREFALVGGLAVSVRSEIRFTRDVDLAVIVESDADAEELIFDLKRSSYVPIVTVEHDIRARLSTVRLQTPASIIVDLLFASSGIESEVVRGATSMTVTKNVKMPVASTEELIAMKILSMSARRLQDRIDVQRLIQYSTRLDVERIRRNLRLIVERGYHRDEDLLAQFEQLLSDTELPNA